MTRRVKFLFGFLSLLSISLFAFHRSAFGQGASTIVDTKHNLSVSGPGPVKALGEDRICIFCHTPHGGRSDAPLWNRMDSQAAYIPYDSPTLVAQPGQPTGASKLCLSCHDGTVAMGDLLSESSPISITGGGFMPPGGGLIGTDLRDDHPISFAYSESISGGATDLAPPGSWDPRIQLDAAGMLQCTTCHDPHDDTWGDFLVMDNMEASMCRECHTIDFFDGSPHALSTATARGGTDPWPNSKYKDVRSNACMNCHQNHHAPGQQELLTHRKEEEVCLKCHDGSVAQTNLRSVMRKISSHPVDRSTGVHSAGEEPRKISDHVECVDCHNPHRARAGVSEPPFIQGVMEGVSGVNALGIPVEEASFEYEVCFKCHGESAPPPLSTISRDIPTANLIREFSPSSPSFHPVEQPGRNPDVPSLISPLTPASMIYCSDCHGNDEQDFTGGGVAGPHGSNHDFMLVREYRTQDGTSESASAYALCYGCHSRTSILNDESFPQHRLHVADERTPCSVCHDGHGIDFAEGNAMNNAHLINFDVSVVDRDPNTGLREYQSNGLRSGQCNLTCHGEIHSPAVYP